MIVNGYENLEVFDILDRFENVIKKSSNIPLSQKIIINKDEILDMVSQIRLKMPDELKRAEYVKQEKQKILVEAQQDAETIIKEAEQRINSMINENEIVKKAEKRAAEIISQAQTNAKEIRLGSKDYADEILGKLEDELEDLLKTIKSNRNELRGVK